MNADFYFPEEHLLPMYEGSSAPCSISSLNVADRQACTESHPRVALSNPALKIDLRNHTQAGRSFHKRRNGTHTSPGQKDVQMCDRAVSTPWPAGQKDAEEAYSRTLALRMFQCLYDTDLEYMLAGYRRGWACQRVCFRSGGDES